MESVRLPYQGVLNIVRFNWHFYVLSIVGSVLFAIFGLISPSFFQPYIFGISFVMLLITITSLAASFYIYDLSDLYSFSCLKLSFKPRKVLNITAGFDESSGLIEKIFPNSVITALDFYDPEKHTEVSIKRAQKVYPAYPNTKYIETTGIGFDDKYSELIIEYRPQVWIYNQLSLIKTGPN